jgi:hypothetical protein
MDKLNLILTAVAAFASVSSLFLSIKNNRDNKRHKRNKLDSMNDLYNSPLAYQRDFVEHNEFEIERKTLEKDLKIKHKPNKKFES